MGEGEVVEKRRETKNRMAADAERDSWQERFIGGDGRKLNWRIG